MLTARASMHPSPAQHDIQAAQGSVLVTEAHRLAQSGSRECPGR